jgi:uncharacterized protein
MIFVDTGAWFASVVPSDSDHRVASSWMRQNTQPLLTTDYVLDETLTLLRMRGEVQRAIVLGEAFFSGTLATLYYLTEEESNRHGKYFVSFQTKTGVSQTVQAKSLSKGIS